MGLLDDAIREHLELKRLRGADPELVAREERDALDIARGSAPANTSVDDVAEPAGANAGETPWSPEHGREAESHVTQARGFSKAGQETAELDMRTVLEGESDQGSVPVKPVAAQPVPARSPAGGTAQKQEQASLEWEMPAGSSSDEPAMVEEGKRGIESTEQPVEDVLEETPDFLRDTPGQERLWFEQRPPRDFDFGK